MEMCSLFTCDNKILQHCDVSHRVPSLAYVISQTLWTCAENDHRSCLQWCWQIVKEPLEVTVWPSISRARQGHENEHIWTRNGHTQWAIWKKTERFSVNNVLQCLMIWIICFLGTKSSQLHSTFAIIHGREKNWHQYSLSLLFWFAQWWMNTIIKKQKKKPQIKYLKKNDRFSKN